ncbi:MAG: MFS transporter [Isosphaeraceae bacterium]|nr:MFS transporter [Isosphaeraceae bacterium]
MATIDPSAHEQLAIERKARAWAWSVCWLMFASTVLNYMDRQSMTLVGTQIKGEFRLTNVDFGWVLAAFQLSYALFQVPAGFLVDRWNVRWAYAGAVAWWSLAGMAAAYAPNLAILLVMRALLGIGESFNWPCALRVTGTILPPADRSLGNGIFNSGAAIGAVITPVVVTLLTVRYGWRTAFVAVGTLGFVWVVVWLIVVGGPHKQRFEGRKPATPPPDDEFEEGSGRRLSSEAIAGFSGVTLASVLLALSAIWIGRPAIWWGIALLMIGVLLTARVLPLSSLKGADWAESLGAVVRQRRFWILVLVSVTINVCWHFLVNWLPTYLKEDRALTGLAPLAQRFNALFHFEGSTKDLAVGFLTAVLFLAADFGNLMGGTLSRWFTRRGMSPVRARTVVMIGCTLLIPSGVWVGLVRSDALVVVLIGLMAMGTAAFMANYFSFAQEVSARHTGLIVGILGGLGNLCAAGFHPVAGAVKDTMGTFAPIFVVVGLLPFLGMGALAFGWGTSAADPKAD